MNKVGIGTRVINFLVDTLLFSILGYIGYKVNTFYAYYYHTPYYPFYYFFYAAWFVYYLILEGLFARTPGKLLSMSKVVNRQGKRPNFGQILLRSLLRLTLIDCFFIPFLDKTLHDALSGTETVEA
ncbi:RDD family protein [Deminuibacter soli]|uniref:RDD domain-containing protein n=1 Tax=Deminuibacter soli TaxID=2291815 RepID=A0A3E1NL76_9BACT|nr:RDD family protein [Deminuibacter soli]RFM28685.1 hypothetical protein DXN05_07795 [Deminuibacter soli]